EVALSPRPEPQDERYVRRKFESIMTVELDDLLYHKQRDRSRALWRIYNECFRLGIPKEDCFQLCLYSPNNKFASEKRSGMDNLWRDVCYAYADATTRVSQR